VPHDFQALAIEAQIEVWMEDPPDYLLNLREFY
jgi:hypothetical protein